MKKLWHLILFLCGYSEPKQLLPITAEEKQALIDDDLLSSDLPDYVSPPKPHLDGFNQKILQAIDTIEARREARRATVMTPELLQQVIDQLAAKSLDGGDSSYHWFIRSDIIPILGEEEFDQLVSGLRKLLQDCGVETVVSGVVSGRSLGVSRPSFQTYLKRIKTNRPKPPETITTSAYR